MGSWLRIWSRERYSFIEDDMHSRGFLMNLNEFENDLVAVPVGAISRS